MASKRKFKFPLYLQIVIGMVVGILVGIIALSFNGERFVRQFITPWGQLFIRLLQLIAIPLVFVSLVKGVMGLHDIRKFSRMGLKTIGIYICTTVVAVVLGLTLGLVIKPGRIVDSTQVAHLQESYHVTIESHKEQAVRTNEEGPLAFLREIVPDNIIRAAADNTKMLQIIFFAIFFAIAALSVAPLKIKSVMDLFDGLNDIILRMVDYIIKIAPFGVAALMAGLLVEFQGNLSIFGALGTYALTVILGLFTIMLLFYPSLIHFFTKIPVKHFLKTIYPVQLFAFTTSSSAATLPVNLETVEKELGVSNETASFVLPVGATINMDGTSCYQAIAIVFIAQVLGVDLTMQKLLLIVGMTVLSSIGTPSIPGGSYVILTMVLATVGIPPEGLALLLGIDRPLDMLRTAVNVTGDATVAAIVDGKTN